VEKDRKPKRRKFSAEYKYSTGSSSAALFKPSRSGLSMTHRAMAIAARAIRNFAVAAPALLNMTTQGRCAADRNRLQRVLLIMRERVSKDRQVSLAVEAENVAQLQRRRFH